MSQPSAATVPGGSRLKWAFADAMVITRRNLLRFVRIPALLVFSVVQPLMFVLLFVYVFGGNLIQIPGVSYVNFLLPGIFVQTAIFGTTNTGIGLAEDLGSGIIDRFRSLPMARSAVLAGRTFADLGRNLVVVGMMIAVGYLVGFSFKAGPIDALGAVGLAVRRVRVLVDIGVDRPGHQGHRIGPGGKLHLDLPAHVRQLGAGPRAGDAEVPAGGRPEQPRHHLGEHGPVPHGGPGL